MVDFPEFLLKEGVGKQFVAISFRIDSNNNIELLEITGANIALNNYVMQQIEASQLQIDRTEFAQEYSTRLCFELR